MIRYANLLSAGIILAMLSVQAVQHGTGSLGMVTGVGSMTGLLLIGMIRNRRTSTEVGVQVSVKEMTEVPPKGNHRHGLILFDVTISNRSFCQRKYLAFRLRVHRPDGVVDVYDQSTFTKESRATPISCFLGGPLVLNSWWRSPSSREGTLGFLKPVTSPEDQKIVYNPENTRREIVVSDLLSGRVSLFPLDCGSALVPSVPIRRVEAPTPH